MRWGLDFSSQGVPPQGRPQHHRENLACCVGFCYLWDTSTGDFQKALAAFLGKDGPNVLATAIFG
jgi:hypothetical protein